VSVDVDAERQSGEHKVADMDVDEGGKSRSESGQGADNVKACPASRMRRCGRARGCLQSIVSATRHKLDDRNTLQSVALIITTFINFAGLWMNNMVQIVALIGDDANMNDQAKKKRLDEQVKTLQVIMEILTVSALVVFITAMLVKMKAKLPKVTKWCGKKGKKCVKRCCKTKEEKMEKKKKKKQEKKRLKEKARGQGEEVELQRL
jgi:hypothetical protein